MRKILLFVILAVLLTSVPSFGVNKIRWKDMDWQTYETEHFKIYYYKGEDFLAKLTAIYAEQAYIHDTAVLDFKPKNSIPLFIYQNHIDFASTNITLDPLTEDTGGFTEPYKNRVVLPGTGSLKQLRQVIFHECTHAVQFSILYGEGLRSYNVIYKDLFNPLWVMEGMAEYCADDFDSQGEMVLRDAVIHDRLIPLDKMDGFAHLEEVYLAYKEAQSVFMYMEKIRGPKVISELIKYSGQEAGLDGPFKKILRKDFNTFKDEWAFYLKRKYWAQVLGRDSSEKYGPRLTKNTRENFTYDQGPAFSPDGTKIAFISTRDGDYGVYVMRSDGKEQRKVFSGFDAISTEGRPISWAADNVTVYFAATVRGKRYIYKGDTGNGETRQIAVPGIFDLYSPAISPDNAFIAFTGNVDGFSDIYVYDIASGTAKKITDNIYENNSPSWSPDGSTMAFTEERDDYARIAAVDLKSGKKRYITKPGQYNYVTPSFISNDELIFTSDKNGIFNLYKINVSGANETQLTNVIGGALYPSYNNGWVVYSNYEDGCENIYKYLDDRKRDFQTIPLVYDESLLQAKGNTPAQTPVPAPAVVIAKAGEKDDTEERDKIEAEAREIIKKNEPYATLLTPDLLFALFGYGTDTGLIGGGYLTASDMLGNHNLSLLVNFVPGYYSQFELSYQYMSLPIDVGLSLYYDQNVYQLYDVDSGNFLSQLNSTEFGGAVSLKYPFNLTTSLELDIQSARTNNNYTNFQTGNAYIFEGANSDQLLNSLGVTFLYDHASWRDFWPYTGEVFTFYAEAADKFFGGTQTYSLYEADLKKYFDLSFNGGKNLNLSAHLLLAATDGPDRPLFLVGGPTTLRGLEYGELTGDRIGLLSMEFRYTLAKNMNLDIWPITFLMLKNIKLAFFDDMGLVRTGSLENITNDEMKNGMGLSMVLDTFLLQREFIPLKLEVAKRTDIRDNIWKFYFSLNTGF